MRAQLGRGGSKGGKEGREGSGGGGRERREECPAAIHNQKSSALYSDEMT